MLSHELDIANRLAWARLNREEWEKDHEKVHQINRQTQRGEARTTDTRSTEGM